MTKNILSLFILLAGLNSSVALAYDGDGIDDDRAGRDLYTTMSLNGIMNNNQAVMDWVTTHFPSKPADLKHDIEVHYSSYGDVWAPKADAGPEGTDGVSITFDVSAIDDVKYQEVVKYNEKHRNDWFFRERFDYPYPVYLAGLQKGKITPVSVDKFNVNGGVYEITLLKLDQSGNVLSTSPAVRVKLNRDRSQGKIGFVLMKQ